MLFITLKLYSLIQSISSGDINFVSIKFVAIGHYFPLHSDQLFSVDDNRRKV